MKKSGWEWTYYPLLLFTVVLYLSKGSTQIFGWALLIAATVLLLLEQFGIMSFMTVGTILAIPLGATAVIWLFDGHMFRFVWYLFVAVEPFLVKRGLEMRGNQEEECGK